MDEEKIQKCLEELKEIMREFETEEEAEERVTIVREKYGPKVYFVASIRGLAELDELEEREIFEECAREMYGICFFMHDREDFYEEMEFLEMHSGRELFVEVMKDVLFNMSKKLKLEE